MKGSQSQVNFFAEFSLKVQTTREKKKKTRQKKRKPCFSELGFAWTMMEKSARLSSFDTNFPPQRCIPGLSLSHQALMIEHVQMEREQLCPTDRFTQCVAPAAPLVTSFQKYATALYSQV